MMIDLECIRLCAVLNKIEGLRTINSCCGHGNSEFRIYFKASNEINFNKLLKLKEKTLPDWKCLEWTDPQYFALISSKYGFEAYLEAYELADHILNDLK